MITEIVFTSKDKFDAWHPPGITLPAFLFLNCPEVPKPLNGPFLRLEFDDADPYKLLNINERDLTNAKDKVSYKAKYEKIKQRYPKIATERDAEKIINYCDVLQQSETRWTLYITCPDGRKLSASVARFLAALKLESITKITGTNCSGTEWHNLHLSGLLAYQYGKLFSMKLSEGKVNDANADSGTTVRG
jgi:hypothetical protein